MANEAFHGYRILAIPIGLGENSEKSSIVIEIIHSAALPKARDGRCKESED